MEKYPLYIDGEEKGFVAVKNDRLMTSFEAECEKTGKIIKLYIFGNGEKAYLGTMQPRENRLHLIKKFSRNDMKSLPEIIEYAADAQLHTEEAQNNISETVEEDAEHEDDGLLWFSTPDGCLTCFDGYKSLVAIPADNIMKTRLSGVFRSINGREYVIFPGKRNASNSGNFH